MMRATTRPRRSSGARSAAKGIMTCPATDAPPTRKEARAKNHSVGARAQATSATGGQEEEPCDQATARVQIAERDNQQQAGGVADLGGRDDGRGRPRPAVEAPCDLVQDRLGVVEVGHDGTRGDRDENNEWPGQSGRHGRASGRVGSTRPGSAQTVPPRRLSAVTPVNAVRIRGTPMKMSHSPNTSEAR